MSMYIGIEDLAANALVELMAQGRRFVRFSDLLAYGTEVVKILRGQKVEAVLLYSREATFHFFKDYAKYFELQTVDGWEGIALKNDVSDVQLARIFLSSLNSQVLEAMQDQRAVQMIRKAA